MKDPLSHDKGENAPHLRPAHVPPTRRAVIVGTGLIGASVGMALREAGWHVAGIDADPAVQAEALALHALDDVGFDDEADLAVIATPLASVVSQAELALAKLARSSVVTDVAGVKLPVVSAIHAPNFIGGHPMAGSEQQGVRGASPDLFRGATWVLTPGDESDSTVFARLGQYIAEMGAEVVSLRAGDHDELVAVVSHVPHLVAATMMAGAAARAEEQAVLLRLAAGGFRDMTRISAGDPGIWPDICSQNSAAILGALDNLLGSLQTVRALIANDDTDGLLGLLQQATKARRNLPARASRPEELAELRVAVSDRPGILADLTTAAGNLGINVYDIELAHSAESQTGVAILVVDRARSNDLRDAFTEMGLRPSLRRLS